MFNDDQNTFSNQSCDENAKAQHIFKSMHIFP